MSGFFSSAPIFPRFNVVARIRGGGRGLPFVLSFLPVRDIVTFEPPVSLTVHDSLVRVRRAINFNLFSIKCCDCAGLYLACLYLRLLPGRYADLYIVIAAEFSYIRKTTKRIWIRHIRIREREL